MWLGMNLSLAPNLGAISISNPLTLIPILLPILVVATTWLQFKVTTPPQPPSDDGKPNQAAAMSQSMGTIMPLMYGFFALSFSVGLSIYFIASNTIGIIQYAMMGKADFRRVFNIGGAANKPIEVTPENRIEGRTSKSNSAKRPNNGKDKAAPKVDKAK